MIMPNVRYNLACHHHNGSDDDDGGDGDGNNNKICDQTANVIRYFFL